MALTHAGLPDTLGSMKPTPRTLGLETKLVHTDVPAAHAAGAAVTPVFQSATYLYGQESSYHDVRYIRLNNTPNHDVLAAKFAALEGTEQAFVTGSGMAAISSSLLTVLRAGDHLLAQNCLYGGTLFFVQHELPSRGIDVTLVDLHRPESWRGALRPTTKAFYVEGIANPLMEVGDLAAVTAFAREHALVSLIDNTIATPVNFRPAAFGFDVVLHSATKYLNGHSDIVAGVVAGRHDLTTRIRHTLDHYGGSLDPHACFLLERGLKTLALRVRYQNESALRIARFLAEHPAVERVNYPGLPGTPSFARASEWFGGFGGMVSFELGTNGPSVEAFLERMTIALVAPSLGGAETLVTQPARTSHAGLTREERSAAGISDGLVRLSVGLETTDDLIADFRAALAP